MSTLQLHPAVVHLPLALAVVVPLVLLALLWSIRNGKLPPRVWLLGVGLQGLLLLGALAAVATGNAEEERVESTVAEARVEQHARAGQLFAGASAAVLVGALVALAMRRHRERFSVAGASTVLLSVLALGLAVRVGHQGGMLVHAGEASLGAAASPAERAAGSASETQPPGQKDNDEGTDEDED